MMQDNIQLTHDHHIKSDKKLPLSIIANDMRNPLNVGSLFRLCDALGIQKLYLCGDTLMPPNSKISKTSRCTEKHVAHETHDSAEILVRLLKNSGMTIISLEITTSSVDINSETFQNLVTGDKEVCLILGSENSGVGGSLLSLSDLTVHIPMAGNNSSMNVVTAAAIACYETSKYL